MQPYNQVVQRPGDSKVYLNVRGQWYFYDTNSIPLGDGAMGTVYLGFSCSSNQRIAIKRVKDLYANNKAIRARAKQEASLVFSHPNLVQMIGYCEVHPDYGPIFILSGYVPGITLDTHVNEQLSTLPLEDRVEKISNEICHVLDALQYLHSKGIVHRDVKPSNIMLENGSVVKLMDLGIARLNGGNKYSSYGFIGTPQYAAPEQILRDSEKTEVNAQTDIYALGVTYYELLTGNNPFKSEIETDMLSNQIKMKLPYNKNIPRRLYNVILKATEKEAERRYKSASDFKFAIIEALNRSKDSDFKVFILDNWRVLSVIIIAIILSLTFLFFIVI